MLSNYTAIVLARNGSKRLAKKNKLCINNIPLYLHAVNQGMRTCGNVILNTDIPSAELDLPKNVYLYERPTILGGDTITSSEVIMDMLNTLNLSEQTLVLLQPTSPLRQDSDIYAAIDLYQKNIYELVVSVSTVDNSCLKYGILEQGRFIPLACPEYCFANTQQLPEVYKPNGAVYIFNSKSFLINNGFPSSDIGTITMPDSHSIDIDCYDDFILASQSFINSNND